MITAHRLSLASGVCFAPPGLGLGLGLSNPRRAAAASVGGVPSNALTYGGDTVTYGGDYVTYGA